MQSSQMGSLDLQEKRFSLLFLAYCLGKNQGECSFYAQNDEFSEKNGFVYKASCTRKSVYQKVC